MCGYVFLGVSMRFFIVWFKSYMHNFSQIIGLLVGHGYDWIDAIPKLIGNNAYSSFV